MELCRMSVLSRSLCTRLLQSKYFVHPSQCRRSSRSIASTNNEKGRSISELFEYTSGRWIYNESLRRTERTKIFNVAELQRLAAESVSRTVDGISSFRKLAEGGFNRTFELVMQDGFKLVARIPYLVAAPRRSAVASEVATMTFLRERGLPVPRIYAYSSTSQNAAGTEYIFMEYAEGTNLGDVWFNLEQADRLKVLDNIVLLEARMFDLTLPAFGSLYFMHDLPANVRGVEAGRSQDGRTLGVGPDTALALWYGRRSLMEANRGPFTSIAEVLAAGADKEIAYLKAYGRPLLPYHRIRRETFNYEEQQPAVHIDSLQKYKCMAAALTLEVDSKTMEPTSRHPDLQPNNIFISDDLEITAIIDWQHCSILPMSLHCGMPNIFNNLNDLASRSLTTPQLPDNMLELGEEEQYEATETFNKQQLHYEYVMRTQAIGGKHFKALSYSFSMARRHLYELSCSPWEADNTSLRSSLISMMQNWQNITAGNNSCPISFSPEEQAEYLKLEEAQREADAIVDIPRQILDIGPNGWVPNDQYERVMAGLAAFKDEALEAAESEDDRKTILAHWPWDDMDETPYL